MNLNFNLQQQQEARLALTPHLKQSLEILNFSLQELEAYIRDQAQANPLIELKETNHHLLDMARLRNSASPSTGNPPHDVFDSLQGIASEGSSIEIYLMEQLAVQRNLTKHDKKIILYLIRNLSEAGYLECDLEEVGGKFNVPQEECERFLALLQSFEPAGVGARCLAECLYLQLSRSNNVPKLALHLVQHHLEELANGDYQMLADRYQVRKEEIEEVFVLVRQLNPFPFREIQPSKQEYIIPDIIIEEFNGVPLMRINEQHLPQIGINAYYEELLRMNGEDETTDYLRTKLSDAFLLMRGIEQRHETLYKVIEVMLQKQAAFMRKGKSALVPMTLKDVAHNLALHESTISRAIRHKYVQTPHGTFPLKTFFVRGIKMRNGDNESPKTIKEKIKALIQQEDLKKPLSDQKIANLLVAENIQIARRTIAKYREELGIPPSSKRAQKR